MNIWYCRKQIGAWLKAETCLMSASTRCIYDIIASINIQLKAGQLKYNIFADQVQPFIFTLYCFFKQGSVSLSQDGSRKLLYSTPMVCAVPRSQPNKTLLGWGEVGCSQHLRHGKTAKTMLSSQYRSKSLCNISGTLLNQCLKKLLAVLRVEERPTQ